MDMSDSQPRLWCNQDFPGGIEVPLPGGRAAVYSTRAPGKEIPNEDSVAVIPYPPAGAVLAVADGLGGMPAGGEASRVMVESLGETLSRNNREHTPAADAVVPAIQAANQELIGRARGNATTMAVAAIDGRTLRTYHAGDSGALVTSVMGTIKVQTIFHSPTGYAQEAGMLSEAEAINHPSRHIVSNVMGTSEMRIEIGPEIELADRDTLVIASDGLFDNLYTEEIVEITRKGALADTLTALCDAARGRMAQCQRDHGDATPGHPDDLTVILYRPDGD